MKIHVLRWARRLLYVVIGYAALFILVFAVQMLKGSIGDPDADLVDRNELDTGNRRTDTAAIVESIRKLVSIYRTPEYQRDAHSKPHGCVRARFEVFDIESKYNHALFGEAGSYEAWVRFSSGTVPALPDYKKDARGMAIKVMDVPGKQLLPPLLAGKTQDFLMISSPNFFIRSVAEYRELEAAAAKEKPFTYFLGDYYLNPFKWRLRELYLGLSTRTKAPPTPLSMQYYSASAYNLGPHQIKYSARPCEIVDPPGINRKDPNFLREGMKKVLKSSDACFQFMVQVRDPNERMPIEDTTVRWSEKKSPFVPIARLHIPKQEFDSAAQNEMCEDMSFTPWHAVEGMEPIGYINELRREVYLHTAAFRRVRNASILAEPESWCDSLEPYRDKNTARAPVVPDQIRLECNDRAVESSAAPTPGSNGDD